MDKWDLDSIEYTIDFFTSATITYSRFNADVIHSRKVKIKVLDYLFFDGNIHTAVHNEIQKLKYEMKKENMTITANNFAESVV
ncbi:hypothetical protein [Priestia flexa]|uniref:hypothetical protein n=1 Tax=Priestia flexa TaxID=86664 RepID=UPI00047389D5|nr:hypothetical protein [Priestia flexa]